LVIPEPQHPEPLPFQIMGPCSVISSALDMLPTIGFDHQSLLQAHEGDVVAPDPMLATELEPSQPAIAQEVPEALLGFGGGFAKLAFAGSWAWAAHPVMMAAGMVGEASGESAVGGGTSSPLIPRFPPPSPPWAGRRGGRGGGAGAGGKRVPPAGPPARLAPRPGARRARGAPGVPRDGVPAGGGEGAGGGGGGGWGESLPLIRPFGPPSPRARGEGTSAGCGGRRGRRRPGSRRWRRSTRRGCRWGSGRRGRC